MSSTKLKTWIERAEPDHYIAFIKAFIPFNAWYMENFYDEEKRSGDGPIMEYLKCEANVFKRRIQHLLRCESEEAEEFRVSLARLQQALEAHPVNMKDPLSFKNICYKKNGETIYSRTQGTITFKGNFNPKMPRKSNRFSVEALNKTGATIAKIELSDPRPDTLKADPEFQRQSQKVQEGLLLSLHSIRPMQPSNLIAEKPKKGDIRLTDKLYFVKNDDEVAQAIIQMFYELRCKLFHGEIEPSESNSHAYEYAALALRIIIKELK